MTGKDKPQREMTKEEYEQHLVGLGVLPEEEEFIPDGIKNEDKLPIASEKQSVEVRPSRVDTEEELEEKRINELIPDWTYNNDFIDRCEITKDSCIQFFFKMKAINENTNELQLSRFTMIAEQLERDFYRSIIHIRADDKGSLSLLISL